MRTASAGSTSPRRRSASACGAEERRLTQDAVDILADLGLAQHALRPAAGLSYGTLKRIELARAMAAHPRLLLLDEPASGLAHSEVDDLGRDDPGAS